LLGGEVVRFPILVLFLKRTTAISPILQVRSPPSIFGSIGSTVG
jgi:hypothetical protein